MTAANNLTVNQIEMRRFENELKLLINQRLYDKGCITAEMYTKAKSLILKTA